MDRLAKRSGDYQAFLERKSQLTTFSGFSPQWIPDFLFDFQKALVAWAIQKGKSAIFADTGLGKTAMELVWAQNVVEHTNKRVLILAPIAVGTQTVEEGDKFGVPCARSRDGSVDGGRIIVANYERLHYFQPADFAGVICDESSILKHFSGATQKAVTRFLLKVPYRLLATATPAPNDYIELGTSSEALGELGYSDMLSRFFRQTDRHPHRMEEIKQWRKGLGGNHFAKLAFRVSQQIGQWRLKGHAEVPFWRWVASWARACRRPSDLGFADDAFQLPALTEHVHLVEPRRPPPGLLFTVPAFGLRAERDERRRTLEERTALVSRLIEASQGCALIWCHLNAEGDALERALPGSVQVKGADPEERKEEAVQWFCRDNGSRRVLISKPRIFGWGLNLQHCAHVVTFVTHSWEQYYQAVRRCWRFGQRHPVIVDIIATTGERHVLDNMARKAEDANRMFAVMVRHMHDAEQVERNSRREQEVQLPSWLS